MTGGDLYCVTAKGAKEHALGIAFVKAKEEWMHIEFSPMAGGEFFISQSV